jgi:hypothetical protein
MDRNGEQEFSRLCALRYRRLSGEWLVLGFGPEMLPEGFYEMFCRIDICPSEFQRYRRDSANAISQSFGFRDEPG